MKHERNASIRTFSFSSIMHFIFECANCKACAGAAIRPAPDPSQSRHFGSKSTETFFIKEKMYKNILKSIILYSLED